MSKKETFEIVIPVFNEQEALPGLLREIDENFSKAHDLQDSVATTLVFVDDGSVDNSAEIIRGHKSEYLGIRLIKLSRNFGHQAALTAGLIQANADWVGIMDADLQDPPDVLLQMLKMCRGGMDVVYGVRRTRQEGVLKKLFYWLFYRVYQMLSPISVPVDSGDFCVMSRRVVFKMNELTEKVRFIRGLRSWVGYRQEGLLYDRQGRFAGKSKYSFRQLYELATNGITSLSIRPLQVSQLFSLVFSVMSMFAFFVLALFLLSGKVDNPWILVLVAFIFLVNANILFGIYILGAYVGRAYLEGKDRPPFVVDEVFETRVPDK